MAASVTRKTGFWSLLRLPVSTTLEAVLAHCATGWGPNAARRRGQILASVPGGTGSRRLSAATGIIWLLLQVLDLELCVRILSLLMFFEHARLANMEVLSLPLAGSSQHHRGQPCVALIRWFLRSADRASDSGASGWDPRRSWGESLSRRTLLYVPLSGRSFLPPSQADLR